MSRLFMLPLLLILTVALAGCSGDQQNSESATASESTATFDGVKTPSAVSVPPTVSEGSEVPVENTPVAERTAPLGTAVGTHTAEAKPKEMTANEQSQASTNRNASPPVQIVPQTATPEEAQRSSLAGIWEFVVCDFGIDLRGPLLEVDAEGDSFNVVIKAGSSATPGWKIQSARFNGNSVRLEFRREEGGVVDFEGELQEDGIVRGNVTFGESGMDMVRWLPSQRESLEQIDPRVPSENVAMMNGFQPSSEESALTELRDKARELDRSALAYELYHRLNSMLYRSKRPSEEDYSGLPEEYVAAANQWGPRVAARAHLEIAHTMALCGYSPEEAKTHLKLAQEQLGKGASPEQESQLTLVSGLVMLASGDDVEQQSAAESLNQIREEDPYNVDVTLGLASYFEQNDQLNKALALYSELAALPTGASDLGPVERIWKELGRNPDDIEDHLNEVYKGRVHQFAEESSDAPRAEQNQRVVLGELFTGSSCPPCVAADVAAGGLEVTYPKSDFIMLRYHVHLPGPDPLATVEGEQRGAEYYRIPGTPMLHLNGKLLDQQTVAGIGGPIFYAPMGYANLRPIVDSLVAEQSDISIALSATANGDEIQMGAVVSGADELPESWRLRLCLAETEIMYPSPNGIRMHEMVVRAMPGGPEGVSPAEGKLQYNDAISLKQVRQDIQDYLSQIPGLPVPLMEMTHLHVVAFVQDDANHEVLQAAAVPVNRLKSAALKPEEAVQVEAAAGE